MSKELLERIEELEKNQCSFDNCSNFEAYAKKIAKYEQALEEIKKTIHTAYDLLDFNKCNNLIAATTEERCNAVITSTLHKIQKCCEVLDER